VTLVESHADEWTTRLADTRYAYIAQRAPIPIVAKRSFRFFRVSALARHGIARSGMMTSIRREALDWIGAYARARNARIHLRAGIAVVTRCSLGFFGIGTKPRRGITRAGIVTGIGCRTSHRICSYARARNARIHLRACVAIIANRAGQKLTRAIGGRSGRHRTRIACARITRVIATNAVDTESRIAIRRRSTRGAQSPG